MTNGTEGGRPPSNPPNRSAIVRSIMARDFKEWTRDRFIVLVSVLGIVFYAVLWWFLPSEVDETIQLGIVGGGGIDATELIGSSEDIPGIEVVQFESINALITAVEEGDEVFVGLALPTSALNPTIHLYVGAGAPESITGAIEGIAGEIAFALLGIPPPADIRTEILGVDRAGDQVSLQTKFRPLLAYLVLMIESLALASLVAAEIQHKTVKAITVSPAKVSDFLTAKAVFGTLLAFAQAALLLAVIRGFETRPDILIVTLLLGSVLVTGIGLLAGSIGKDFVGIIFWSMLFLIPLIIPAFALLFPGSTAPWIKALPSWPLAEVLVDVSANGAGWREAGPLLAVLALWCVVTLGGGWVILGRRVQRL